MLSELISIIIPVYNTEKYLAKCVDSVLRQSYQNMEIMLVDDGSTDDSARLCDEYAKADPRVTVIHQSNQGVSAARNTAIARVSGVYIAFVDADDIIHPQMIEILYKSIDENHADIAICDLSQFEQITNDFESHIQDKIEFDTLSRDTLLEYLTDDRAYPWIVVTWNKLYKRDIIDSERFPIGKLFEDEYVMHKWFYRCNKAVFTKCKLYYYRRHHESITGFNKEFNKSGYMRFDCRRERVDFYIRKQVPKKIVKQAIEQYIRCMKHVYLACTDKRIRVETVNLCYAMYKKWNAAEMFSRSQRFINYIFMHIPLLYRCYFKIRNGSKG